MSKAVLISIQPKWCELIASGKKTIEVRKTKPKLATPFKCYIYCTYGEGLTEYKDEVHPNTLIGCQVSAKKTFGNCCNGKVIGEFVCDTYVVDKTYGHDPLFNGAACMSEVDAAWYCVNKEMYGWHISDLKIYDEPKDLTDFFVEGECYPPNCSECKYFDEGNGYNVEDDCLLPHHLNDDGNDIKPLFKAPQSWCYVEEV